MNKKVIFWKKIHRYQEKPGWCGPAVIQMVLLASGIKKTQKDIARDVYKPWWGTNQQMLLSYLSRFFKLVNFKKNSSISDINFHLKKGNYIIVNWWDDLCVNIEPDGHYCIVADYNQKKRTLILADPTVLRSGLWEIKTKDFIKKWWDSLDIHGRTWIDGWMLWVDPTSKI